MSVYKSGVLAAAALIAVTFTFCTDEVSAQNNDKNRPAADKVFLKHVAPILQKHCLSCHNDRTRKGDFSLATQHAVQASGFVEPGHAADSHLLDVMIPQNGKAQMPKNSPPLSHKERQTIANWIDSGAHWPEEFRLEEAKVTNFDWWSYQPVKRPNIPKSDSDWPRTPIDAFILRTLTDKSLAPSKPADRRTLIRRLYYDLIGLPPSPEDVAAFVADADPQAWPKLVNRLLESKHYGERWARHWLDVVKYADTCGYDKDKLRPNAWPYRDYVIRSFNEDKPYARFVQEQIAGDILFPGEPDGILGLGFIAAGPWDFIGHVEVPESKIDGKVARNLDRDDMVSNTLNTFCSVTVQCARCHNHKFDPITQDDYYGLQTLFAAVDRAERPFDTDPKTEKRRSVLTAQIRDFEQKLAAVEKEITTAGGDELKSLRAKLKQLESRVKIQKTPEYGYHSKISKQQSVEKWVRVSFDQPKRISRIVLRPTHDEFAGIGAGFGFPLRFKVEITSDESSWKVIADETQRDFPKPGIVPYEVSFKPVDVQSIRVTATKLAKRSSDYIFALAELQAFDGQKNVARSVKVTSLDSIQAPVRWARQNLTDGNFPRAGDPSALNELKTAKVAVAKILQRIETPERIAGRKSINESIQTAQAALKKLPVGRMVYAAATHFSPQGNFHPTKGKLRPIHVLHRGNIQQPGTVAQPGFLPLSASASNLDSNLDEGQRRAALAEWLTDRNHPLVWRSIVNRIWQYHFGTGLVASSNDFGRMGSQPTHPELLDWLASEFREHQSFKQLHRLIVNSSVYRQSSAAHSKNAAIDSSNQFLWRMNRRRLEAEEVRDSILTFSGALNPQMGGPGFYLFKLEKTAHSPHYEYHKFDPRNPASHRRSIYRFIVRSQPDPWMTTLDCADSSQSTPRRNETLTSLQALSLLNNQFTLAMSEKFTARLQQERKTLRDQAIRAFELVTQRAPSPAETQELTAYAKTHGLKNLTRFLLNLNESLFVD